MPDNEPPFDPPANSPPGDEAIRLPPAELRNVSDQIVEVPATAGHSDLGLPERSITQKPRWPQPNFGWSLLWCLLFMIVTQFPGALVAFLVLMGLAVLSPSSLPSETLSKPAALMKSDAMSVALGACLFVTELLVIGFSWLIIRLVIGRDWKRQLALRAPSLAHTLFALASFPALVLLVNMVYLVLRDIFHVPNLFGMSGMEEVTKISSKWQWAFAVAVIGLGPGIGEELWCRGFLGRGLIGNYGMVIGILAASFLFGLIHVDPCQGTAAMFIGLWLHFVYVTTRSLLLPMLLHTLNNSLGVLIPRFPQLQAFDPGPGDVPWLVYMSALQLIVVVAYALLQSRARLTTVSPEQILVWRPAFEGVEYPPANSGMKVVHPLPSPASVLLVVAGFVLFGLTFASWVTRTSNGG